MDLIDETKTAKTIPRLWKHNNIWDNEWFLRILDKNTNGVTQQSPCRSACLSTDTPKDLWNIWKHKKKKKRLIGNGSYARSGNHLHPRSVIRVWRLTSESDEQRPGFSSFFFSFYLLKKTVWTFPDVPWQQIPNNLWRHEMAENMLIDAEKRAKSRGPSCGW